MTVTNQIELINEWDLAAHASNNLYENSRFKNLVGLPPKTKGTRYEKIVRSVCSKLGGKVEAPTSTDYDMLLNGERYEIKGAMLDAKGKSFTFNQIRPDQDYDKLLFAFFLPFQLFMLEMDKSRADELCETGVFKKQHGGKKAESRTYVYKGTVQSLIDLGARNVQ